MYSKLIRLMTTTVCLSDMNQMSFVLRLQQPTAHPQIRSTSSSVLLFHLIIQLLFFPKSRKCQKVLGKNMELWENEVYRFKTIGQLKVGEELGVTGSTSLIDTEPSLSGFRPSVSICPEGICASDRPSTK